MLDLGTGSIVESESGVVPLVTAGETNRTKPESMVLGARCSALGAATCEAVRREEIELRVLNEGWDWIGRGRTLIRSRAGSGGAADEFRKPALGGDIDGDR